MNTILGPRHFPTPVITAICLLLGWFAPITAAGTVKHGLSSTTSWVGSPITLEFRFENISDHQPPSLPDVPGLHITSTGAPNRMSRVQIINGHRTEQSTLTYRYHIDATSPGSITLPAFTLHADGKTYSTDPVELVFLSSDDENLLRAVIQGVPKHAWIGDTIPATLRILIRPFKDSQLQDGVMDASDMWRQVKLDASRWGLFYDRIVALQAENRFPKISEAQVKNPVGETERWYAFDIEADKPLLHAGELDYSGIMIRMDYPMQIGRSRPSFLDPMPKMEITQERPVTTRPDAVHSIVEAPPSQGKPDTWAGAVGQFAFDVTASPTTATVGEPITLTMRITDRGSGRGDLDLLQAPKLEQDKTLTEHFRVPDDRPGGVVSGNTKVFTQTIRPTSVASTMIPAIPFAYFNPKTGSYETSLSRPIPLTVTSAHRIDASAVSGVLPAADSSAKAELTPVRGGLLANYTDADMLLAPPIQPDAWWFALLVLLPPVGFAAIASLQRRRTADRNDPRRIRARKAGVVLARRLETSGGSPEGAATAIRGYVADRLGLPEDAITSREAAAAVRGAGHSELALILQSQLAELERMSYAGDTATTQEPPIQAVRDLVRRLETDLR